jgi:hypothetical protein
VFLRLEFGTPGIGIPVRYSDSAAAGFREFGFKPDYGNGGTGSPVLRSGPNKSLKGDAGKEHISEPTAERRAP